VMMSGVPLETCWTLMNGGIINSLTRFHLVGYFSFWVILRCTDPRILKRIWYFHSGWVLILPSAGIWSRVVWYTCSRVWQEPSLATSVCVCVYRHWMYLGTRTVHHFGRL
jgi:hypothetical protein